MHAKLCYRYDTVVASSLGTADIGGSELIHANYSRSVTIDIPEAPSLYIKTACVQNTADTGSLYAKNYFRTGLNELLSEVLEQLLLSGITTYCRQ